MGSKGPLGELPNMKWCGETNRYYAAQGTHGANMESCNTHGIDPTEAEQIIKQPVDPRIVDTLPRLMAPKKRGRSQSIECSICYRNTVHHTMDPRMRFVSLPCAHSFHLYCVEEWLVKRNGSCPLCRQSVDVSLTIAAKSASYHH